MIYLTKFVIKMCFLRKRDLILLLNIFDAVEFCFKF